MSESDKKSDLSVEEHLTLAAKKLGLDSGTLSDMENGLAQLTSALSRQRVEARLNEPEPSRRSLPTDEQ